MAHYLALQTGLAENHLEIVIEGNCFISEQSLSFEEPSSYTSQVHVGGRQVGGQLSKIDRHL